MLSTHSALACCTFPTRIIAIDDQPAIIDSLRFSLGTQIKTLSDPLQALETLSAYRPAVQDDLWLNVDHTSDLWDGVHKQSALINIKNILSLASLPARVDDISVLIVDYQMPGMDGLTLLHHLADKPFKKILLTGTGSDAMAVQAFNDGLIDYFLHKDDVALREKIRHATKQLKQQYFIDMSKKTRDLLEKNTAIFSNPETASFFYEKIAQMKVTEFYLLDMNGSYLLKNESQEQHHLLIHTAAHIDMMAEHAKSDYATSQVVNALQEKKAFPYFGEHKFYWQVDGQYWARYLQPLNEIKTSSQSFYVAVF